MPGPAERRAHQRALKRQKAKGQHRSPLAGLLAAAVAGEEPVQGAPPFARRPNGGFDKSLPAW